MNVLPFPVKKYLFEIFTRATTPGSFLVAHILCIGYAVHLWMILAWWKIIAIDWFGSFVHINILRCRLKGKPGQFFKHSIPKTLCKYNTLWVCKENSFHKPGHGANNAMFWWNENLTKRPFMFQDKNENRDVNRSLVSFWNIWVTNEPILHYVRA